MRFNFSLERIMKLRKKFEDLAREELSKKIKERQEVEERIHATDFKISEFEREFNNELKFTISPQKLQQLIEYREFLKKERIRLIKFLQKKLSEEDAARQEYLKKKNEREVLEKLRERKYDDFITEMRKIENKEMDEVAQNKFLRNKINSDENNKKQA
ncbi:MAG TPA: flagellar export protein FliJ [Petrotogaceae bacterium]|jgi:flagellar FliJ protein|nr:flagellar export protein FliJ [Petrotogaceae bacterium]HQF32942.1 flagellar export protein FliJ [Petrotogaceae bacterium]HQH32048.1 flagellar export protein FliJ [Petrotogaceae bacterium]HQI78099.1 flagellar export protein FliJ [Petrotogaceae bacterium]